MKIPIPGNIRKAKVEIFLGKRLADTYIAIDDKPLPYRSIIIYQLVDKTYVFLERVCDYSGNCTEKLLLNPIEENIAAFPLIVRTTKDNLEFFSKTDMPNNIETVLCSIIEDQKKEIEDLKATINKLSRNLCSNEDKDILDLLNTLKKSRKW
jgi:hypothetical protein